MLENAIPVTVALVLPHSDGDKAEVESRLSVLRKKLDPKVFERNIRSEIDVTLATMLAHCAAGDDETDGEVPEPEATALRDLKVAVSDAAAKPSTNVMPIYTWRQTLRGIHVLRTVSGCHLGGQSATKIAHMLALFQAHEGSQWPDHLFCTHRWLA